LDGLYTNQLVSAVAAVGFDLKRVDENQPAGLIDDHLRVKIRQSRFLIADLTHQNRGAYWEAGYAEGLGKPVIYMCRKDVFEDKALGTHFDTNHHLTVVWDPSNIPDFIKRLKDTIRATLPAEAVLEDKA
jgi:nucleoside 2-deoxyribosyltransferase